MQLLEHIENQLIHLSRIPIFFEQEDPSEANIIKLLYKYISLFCDEIDPPKAPYFGILIQNIVLVSIKILDLKIKPKSQSPVLNAMQQIENISHIGHSVARILAQVDRR